MKYKIVISDKCAKSLKKKLKGKLALSIVKKVYDNLSEDPYSKSTKVKNPKLPDRKYRIGDYRVLFDIVDDEIRIIEIDHRKNVYDK